ncbi:MAG: hypothetical protein AAFX03_05260 [Pseudomonadota bacterium]
MSDNRKAPGRRWVWTIIAIALVLLFLATLGAFVYGGAMMFLHGRDRVEPTQALIEDRIGAERENSAGELAAMGALTAVDRPTCITRLYLVRAPTFGAFVDCMADARFEAGRARVSVGWRYEDEAWTVQSFDLQPETGARTH